VKQVHHLGYTLETLLGLNPAALTTLCIDCHQKCEFDYKTRKKLTFEEARIKTLYVVANRKFGKNSGRQIGLWYKNRWNMNRETAQRILNRIRDELPEWYTKIVGWLKDGTIGVGYKSYLFPRKSRLIPKKDVTVQRLKQQLNKRTKK
jgi:hypothetical protein